MAQTEQLSIRAVCHNLLSQFVVYPQVFITALT